MTSSSVCARLIYLLDASSKIKPCTFICTAVPLPNIFTRLRYASSKRENLNRFSLLRTCKYMDKNISRWFWWCHDIPRGGRICHIRVSSMEVYMEMLHASALSLFRSPLFLSFSLIYIMFCGMWPHSQSRTHRHTAREKWAKAMSVISALGQISGSLEKCGVAYSSPPETIRPFEFIELLVLPRRKITCESLLK